MHLELILAIIQMGLKNCFKNKKNRKSTNKKLSLIADLQGVKLRIGKIKKIIKKLNLIKNIFLIIKNYW